MLTQKQIDQYHTFGCLILRNVLSAEDIDRLNAEFDAKLETTFRGEANARPRARCRSDRAPRCETTLRLSQILGVGAKTPLAILPFEGPQPISIGCYQEVCPIRLNTANVAIGERDEIWKGQVGMVGAGFALTQDTGTDDLHLNLPGFLHWR